MHWLWVLIVGAIIGAIAGAITHHSGAMGRISNIIAGLVGSALGEALLGHWGPQLAGMAIIPSLIGAIVVVAVVSFFLMRSSAKNSLVAIIGGCGSTGGHSPQHYLTVCVRRDICTPYMSQITQAGTYGSYTKLHAAT